MAAPKFRMVDLCAGTGGFSVAGLSHFSTVYANDLDPAAKVIFDANHPDLALDCRPLEHVSLEELNPLVGTVDLITGGFPCQPYSVEGQRLGLIDPRSDVFEDLLHVVQHLQPRWFVCENVSNLARLHKGEVFKAIQAKAQQYLPGWQCRWTLYNTVTHTGVPQNRERVYIIWFNPAYSDSDRFTFPEPNPVPRHVSSVLVPDDQTVPDKYYYTPAMTSRVARAMVRDVVQPVRSTGVVYQRRPDFSVRQNQSGVVPALTARMGYGTFSGPVVRDSRGVRKLTPRECFNAQGFPQAYVLPDTQVDSKLYRLAGNAITVPVAKLVLDALYDLSTAQWVSAPSGAIPPNTECSLAPPDRT